MGSPSRFERLSEWTCSLPSYRWVSIVSFRIKSVAMDASSLLAAFVKDEAYADPYVELVSRPAHGPYPFGSITPSDFETVSISDVETDGSSTNGSSSRQVSRRSLSS